MDRQQKLKNFDMTDAGAGFLFAVLGIIGVQFLLGMVWGAGTKYWGWPDITETQRISFVFLILSGLALQAVLACFYLLYTRHRRICHITALPIGPMPQRNWLLAAATGVAALFGLMFTSFAFDLLFTGVFGYKAPELPGFDTLGRAAGGIFFLGVLPAVFEELIFRGMMLRGLKGLGKLKAVLISAAAFALTHMSPSQTVHQFLLGVVMGLVAWETGSILAPMLIHFINNALAVVLEYSGFFEVFTDMAPWQIIIGALVTFAAVCGIMYLILRLIKKPGSGESGEIRKEPMPQSALVFLISGFCVTGIFWLAALLSGVYTAG